MLSVFRTPRHDIAPSATTALSACDPRKVADRHFSLFLEVAQLLGDGERQVVQRGFCPYRDMHVFLLERALRAGERSQVRSGWQV